MTERLHEHHPAHNQPHFESLSWNPLLIIMETTHAINRLHEESAKANKETQKENRIHQNQIADETMRKLFQVHGEKKRLFFSLTPLDNPDKNLPELEFVGFSNNEGRWYLGFVGEEGPLNIPMNQLEHSEQISHFRDETVSNN